jgi:hypothetical protein
MIPILSPCQELGTFCISPLTGIELGSFSSKASSPSLYTYKVVALAVKMIGFYYEDDPNAKQGYICPIKVYFDDFLGSKSS